MYSQCEDNTDQQLLQAILKILDRFTFLFALSREYGGTISLKCITLNRGSLFFW